MKNACKMTIKQVPVPAKWTDGRTDEPDAAIETTNTTTTTTTLMMTWTWTLLPVLCRGKALAREATAAVRPMWVSLYLCVCVCGSEQASVGVRVFVGAQSEDKQFIVCKCLVVVARGLRSAIPAASSLWPAHLTIVNTPALCATSSGQQPVSSGNKRLVFGAVYW